MTALRFGRRYYHDGLAERSLILMLRSTARRRDVTMHELAAQIRHRLGVAELDVLSMVCTRCSWIGCDGCPVKATREALERAG